MKIEIEFQMNRIKGVNSKLIFIWSIDSKFVIQCGLIQCLATFNFSYWFRWLFLSKERDFLTTSSAYWPTVQFLFICLTQKENSGS